MMGFHFLKVVGKFGITCFRQLEIECVNAHDLCVIVYDILVKVVFSVKSVCGDEDVKILFFGIVIFATYVSMIVCLFCVRVTIEVHLVWVSCIEEHGYGIVVHPVADGCFTLWCEVDAVAMVGEGRVCV